MVYDSSKYRHAGDPYWVDVLPAGEFLDKLWIKQGVF